MVKCSKDQLPDNCSRHIGHAGVALIWKKSFRSVIVEVDSDRMCVPLSYQLIEVLIFM